MMHFSGWIWFYHILYWTLKMSFSQPAEDKISSNANSDRDIDFHLQLSERDIGGTLGSLLGSEAPRWRARGHPGAYTASPGTSVDHWVACWGQRPLGGGPGGTLGPILQVQKHRR